MSKQTTTGDEVLNELALFAGAGGGILGGHLLGWRTVCAVEWDAYAASVLVARQNDGSLPPFPIWDDVQTFDGRPWRGIVDVVSGGFPCQDISAAGKGAGIDGERSGMWAHMARIVREVEPRYVFVENSSMLTSRGLGRVLGDLAAMGYDARWGVLGAVHAGAHHRRERIWIVANAKGYGSARGRIHYRDELQAFCRKEPSSSTVSSSARFENVANADGKRREECNATAGVRTVGQPAGPSAEGWWDRDPADGPVESGMGRVAHGVAYRVDRLKALGNGQVSAVAALAWQVLR
jgi:DNA (cytosine-5)-methyltransferase 1